MSLAVLHSRALAGLHAPEVTVEVHLTNGLPNFTIVGLPEAEVKEARDRVRAAIINSRFEFPARRVTVNLAPADLPKESGRFDLAILGSRSIPPLTPPIATYGLRRQINQKLNADAAPIGIMVIKSCRCGALGNRNMTLTKPPITTPTPSVAHQVISLKWRSKKNAGTPNTIVAKIEKK